VVRLGISNVPNDVLQKRSPHLVALEAVLSDLVEYGLAMDAQKPTTFDPEAKDRGLVCVDLHSGGQKVDGIRSAGRSCQGSRL
jgi:hypothetical protein